MSAISAQKGLQDVDVNVYHVDNIAPNHPSPRSTITTPKASDRSLSGLTLAHSETSAQQGSDGPSPLPPTIITSPTDFACSSCSNGSVVHLYDTLRLQHRQLEAMQDRITKLEGQRGYFHNKALTFRQLLKDEMALSQQLMKSLLAVRPLNGHRSNLGS
ncbi:hypothetical protein BKA70DRAFT_1430768 [Coprinopsis sp. MPI-PUGE-AT-0042]|nr:hypothetical protein BKA70DRAFT_1430768 [Coprinopsis sp. MPI-PUGE-AT-0042]